MCGGIDLSKRDQLHVIGCIECETLAEQIAEALDEIQTTLEHGKSQTS